MNDWTLKVKRRYEYEAKDYDRTRAPWVKGLPFNMELDEIRKNLQDGLILHVGVGTGKFIPYFNSRMVGIDLSLNSLKIAKNKDSGVEVMCADAHYFPFKPETFSNIICSRGIKFFYNVQEMLCETEKTLCSGGHAIIIIDYCRDYFLYRLLVPFVYKKFQCENSYGLKDFKNFVKNVKNLKIIEAKYFLILPPFLYEHAPERYWKLLRKLDMYLSRIFKGWGLIVILRKAPEYEKSRLVDL